MFLCSMHGLDEEGGWVCFLAPCMVVMKKEAGYVSLLDAWFR